MKNKIVSVAILAASGLVMLASCGTPTCSNGNDSTAQATTATLKGAYSSPAIISYSNMRPNYNYYLTTFSFETIALYDDNSYILNFSASTFSGVILPEEGNEAQGNERENYIRTYKGTYTATPDAFDPNVQNCTFSIPTSLLEIYNQKYYVNTLNWDDAAKENTKVGKGTTDTTTGTTKVDHYDYYATGEEYLNGVTAKDGDVLPGHTYTSFTADLDSSNYSFAYVKLFAALVSAM